MYLCKTDNTGDDIKISNYSLHPVVKLQKIKSSRNKFTVKEQLLVRLTKESEPENTYPIFLTGSNEEDVKSFIKAIHKGTIGL